jgi:hypothetical protein
MVSRLVVPIVAVMLCCPAVAGQATAAGGGRAAGASLEPALQAARQKPKARPGTAANAMRKQPAEMECPAELGVGVATKRRFCDVLTGDDPAKGIIIRIPPHRGPATLSFDLHNRQTYSEQEVKAKKAYEHYTASIGVFAPDNTLITRAVIDSEFRSGADLFDRIAGGAGPRGVKAVAPTGDQPVSVEIPADADFVSILGEKLIVVGRSGGTETYTSPGRAIAAISNVMIEYRPAPPKRPPAKKTPVKKKQP